MGNFKFYIYKVVKTPPHKLMPKVIRKLKEEVIGKYIKIRDLYVIPKNIKNYPKVCYSYLNVDQLDVSTLDIQTIDCLTNMYLSHSFDLLGSGWVKVDYNINPFGVEGNAYNMSLKINDFDRDGKWLKKVIRDNHLLNSIKIWNQIDSDYSPIDWQIDFKSGYRWSAKDWYKEQVIGRFKGADIKVPWELSRLQHLPQLAIFSLVLKERKNEIIKEFRNQILDFIATNPVNMGANWTCTMDVGIRAANMLVAYDLLLNQDDENILDIEFQNIFSKNIYEHGKFITNNFEWSEVLTSNHYLANICGLLFIASYLERTEETDAWLVFSVQELISEVDKQFNDDGSNFEASTSYHRLSGEMVIYSTAIAFGCLAKKKYVFQKYNNKLMKRLKPFEEQQYRIDDETFFPTTILEKIKKSGSFTMDLFKPNYEVPQIGDNDSGRFLKFTPVGVFYKKDVVIRKYKNLSNYSSYFEKYWDENINNHTPFISAVNGLFNEKDFEQYTQFCLLEKTIIQSLSNGKKFLITEKKNRVKLDKGSIPDLKFKKETIIDLGFTLNVNSIDFKYYSDFGVYIFKNHEFYLIIVACDNGQNGNGGHAHNDKLSFELYYNGKNQYVDPGTYMYTPIPQRRNEFRKTSAHNTISVNDLEQNEFLSLFSMKNQTNCQVIELSKDYIKLYANYRNVQHIRSFHLTSDKIIIKDSCNFDFQLNFNKADNFSNGYGKLIQNKE